MKKEKTSISVGYFGKCFKETIATPTVVEYRYKLFGILPCRGMTIVDWKGEPFEKLVEEKTGHKKITIITTK